MATFQPTKLSLEGIAYYFNIEVVSQTADPKNSNENDSRPRCQKKKNSSVISLF